MEHGMPDHGASLVKLAGDFARDHVATRPDLSRSSDFPHDVWRAMGEAGLLGLGVPQAFGGHGCGFGVLGEVGRELTRRGRCLGITLMWMMQQIVARFVFDLFATNDQKARYLPGMAKGDVIACMAISEPGAGAHPARMNTRAEPSGAGFVLRGEKTFLTNAPVANLFVVIAVSKTSGPRKLFTAYLVPEGRDGFMKGPAIDMGFLRPCPHGSIILDGCVVSGDDVVGSPHSAYEDIVKAFRDVEDVAMMGPLLGAQEARLDEVASVLGECAFDADEEMLGAVGGVLASLEAMRVVSGEASRVLDTAGVGDAVALLVLAYRQIATGVHREMARIESLIGSRDRICGDLSRDLDHLVGFASRVSMKRQIKLGRTILGERDGT